MNTLATKPSKTFDLTGFALLLAGLLVLTLVVVAALLTVEDASASPAPGEPTAGSFTGVYASGGGGNV